MDGVACSRLRASPGNGESRLPASGRPLGAGAERGETECFRSGTSSRHRPGHSGLCRKSAGLTVRATTLACLVLGKRLKETRVAVADKKTRVRPQQPSPTRPTAAIVKHKLAIRWSCAHPRFWRGPAQEDAGVGRRGCFPAAGAAPGAPPPGAAAGRVAPARNPDDVTQGRRWAVVFPSSELAMGTAGSGL